MAKFKQVVRIVLKVELKDYKNEVETALQLFDDYGNLR